MNYPDAIQRKKAVRVIFPNKEESFIAPATWKIAVECKSGGKNKIFYIGRNFYIRILYRRRFKTLSKKMGEKGKLSKYIKLC